MIEKLISPGDKIEMKSTVNVVLPDGTQGIRTYKTSVYDVLDDGKLELVMPMEQQRLVLLPVGGEYDVCFFSNGGTYRADIRIAERQKNSGVYTMIVELISNLHKFQRREYYRFNCIIEMKVKEMNEQETEAFKKGLTYLISEDEMKRGIIVDISGGGLRFVSRQHYTQGSLIMMAFELPIKEINRLFVVAADVISSGEIENRKEEYENRVKFEFIDNTTREEIIKYIFDAERKNRKNGKGR